MRNHVQASSRTTPCDLCGRDGFDIVSLRDRRGHPLTTVVCRCCGLVSHEAIPSDAELDEYYRRKYRLDYQGEHFPSPHRVLRAWSRGDALRRLLAPELKPETRVFEIGSGIGCTVKQFELAGFAASGIEPGDGFCQFSQQRLKARVQRKLLSDVPPIPEFDLVLLVHVLEHLRSPSAALSRAHSILHRDGLLYVEVPDLEAPHARPDRLFHVSHIYNFTRRTLGMYARSAGFRIRRVGSTSNSVWLLLERCEDRQNRIDQGSYDASWSAIRRFDRVTYHLRLRYLANRIPRFVRHLGERIRSRQRLEQILQRCASSTLAQQPESRGFAAGERMAA